MRVAKPLSKAKSTKVPKSGKLSQVVATVTKPTYDVRNRPGEGCKSPEKAEATITRLIYEDA